MLWWVATAILILMALLVVLSKYIEEYLDEFSYRGRHRGQYQFNELRVRDSIWRESTGVLTPSQEEL
jgi:hypothetical protein